MRNPHRLFPSSQKQPTQFPNMFALVHFCEGVLNGFELCLKAHLSNNEKDNFGGQLHTRLHPCSHPAEPYLKKKTSRKVKIPSPKMAHNESPNSASAMTLNFIGRHQGPRVTPLATWLDWMEQFSILSRTAGDRRRISQTDGDLPFTTRTSWR